MRPSVLIIAACAHAAQEASDVTTIFVGGLHADANEDDIYELVREHGLVVELRVPLARPGVCFVEFLDAPTAAAAAAACNGVKVRGRPVRVRLFKD